MKIKIYVLLAMSIISAMLLISCNRTSTPEDGTEASAQTTEEITLETQPESGLSSPETDAEAATEHFETVEPAPEGKVHTAEVKVTAAGETPVEVAALTANSGKDKTHVRIALPLGYRCEGFVCGDVLYQGDVIPLALVGADAKVTLRIVYATYELPIVHISVNAQVIQSKTDYVDMTFSMENTEDVMVAVPGGIRLRGNSTADMPKKPYRIKFDQKQSLFGLDKAKSWVLLAEYLDPSCLHNYAAMYLGHASDELAFTPTIHHVNLYLDGEYMGLYSLCEQVEEERLGIETEVTSDMKDLMDFNFLVCMNERAPEEDQPYFYVASVGRYFQLKYPEREDFTSQRQLNRFMDQLETYYNDMADAFQQGDNAWFKKNLCTDALIDHLIIDQIMGEEDHVWKSFYTYHDATDESRKGKLSFGPIWDYDYCLLTPWTAEPNECYDVDTSVNYSNFFYQGLMWSRYGTKVETRYDQHYAAVLDELIPHLQAYHDTIEASLALNQARWYSFDPDLTEDNFDFLIKFLRSRQKVLKRTWG